MVSRDSSPGGDTDWGDFRQFSPLEAIGARIEQACGLARRVGQAFQPDGSRSKLGKQITSVRLESPTYDLALSK